MVVVVEVVHGGRGGSQDTRVFGRTGAALLDTDMTLQARRGKEGKTDRQEVSNKQIIKK